MTDHGRKIKIGIDVGGTFTHAVAININDFSLVGKACVPTTHTAEEGVAKGVVDSMMNLIRQADIDPSEIILIAHSTTQATNALLEGDVAPVGVIGLSGTMNARLAKKFFKLNEIELAPQQYLKIYFRLIDTRDANWRNHIPAAIQSLSVEGAEVFVATEIFGVDDVQDEDFVVQHANEKGFLATAASRISKLYGLQVRTRTAIINASMMPKMLNTANMTEKAVRESGINAPLMVMRSDGGIMDIAEMRKRPILTMLSGPAAGVAAALRYVKISDGIFLEVGGTSTDISVIRNGKPQIKSAKIGKNRLYVRTLDVRTLGIAGGSLPRMKDSQFISVGPRSAHIANLRYAGYADEEISDELMIEPFRPKKNDPADYIKLKDSASGKEFALTTTEAAYQLNLVREFGHGSAEIKNINMIFIALGKILHREPNDIATDILKLANKKLTPTIHQLMKEYKLEPYKTNLLGGGGGAASLVPFLGNEMNLPFSIAQNTEVLSALGAALGIIKDSVEKNIINPTETELIVLRQEAVESVLRMGANSNTIEVSIEIDSQNKKVIATAYGSTEMRTIEKPMNELNSEELKMIAAKSLRTSPEKVNLIAKSKYFNVFESFSFKKRLLGLLNERIQRVHIVDSDGTVRLQLSDSACRTSTVKESKTSISQIIGQLTSFGDAGAMLPDIFILAEHKIIDMSGLIQESQMHSLADIELQNFLPNDATIVLGARKRT